MAKYVVSYHEVLARTLIVEADSEYEAMEKMMDAVDRGDIELTMDDYLFGSGDIAEVRLATACDQLWFDRLE